MNLSFLGNDKVQHCATGTALGLIACLISLQWGMLVVLLTGVGKEVWDYFGHGTPEWQDVYCTVAGGALGYYMAACIIKFIV